MSDTYHYEDGAVHHDHKRVINIDHIGGDNLGKLLSDFWKDDAEEADVVEEANAMAETKGEGERDEELFHFVHPELGDEEAWRIHDAVKRVVKLQGIQMICQYLSQLRQENKVRCPPTHRQPTMNSSGWECPLARVSTKSLSESTITRNESAIRLMTASIRTAWFWCFFYALR